MLKEKEKELQEECRNKDQQYSQLVTEVQKLPKEVNRSAYTQRILEIINNVRKQRDEISKVLALAAPHCRPQTSPDQLLLPW